MGGRFQGNYTNPCLTMHQPWASLLVYGIKRIEGRSWPAPLRGRLWIHAAGKVPDPATIKAMEDFYREIYAVNGVTDLKFPEHYPVSRLLGCVDVVGCVRCEELVCWEEVPEGVRLEGQTDFCWLCEKPQKLVIPFEMRGNQGVYNLERRIYEAAVRGLCQVEGPLPVKFPLPDPRDPFSLKPGSLVPYFDRSKAAEVEKPASLKAAIDGARAAATQFSKEQKHQTSSSAEHQRDAPHSLKSSEPRNKAAEVEKPASHKTVIDGGRTAATQFSQVQKHQTSSSAEQQRDASDSLKASEPRNREAEVEKPASLKTVVDSAHTAPTQFSEEQKHQTSSSAEQQRDASIPFKANEPRNKSTQDYRRSPVPVGYRDHMVISEGNSSSNIQAPRRDTNHSAGGSKMFAAAMRGLGLHECDRGTNGSADRIV